MLRSSVSMDRVAVIGHVRNRGDGASDVVFMLSTADVAAVLAAMELIGRMYSKLLNTVEWRNTDERLLTRIMQSMLYTMCKIF